jgi:large subunit ribosomal protein L21
MYAIVQIGGRQYRATPGQRVVVDRLEVDPGDEIQLQDVRMVVSESGDSAATVVGTPTVSGVTVTATALGHLRGQKVLVFKYKPKKRYRRQRGFRAELTEIRIDSVGSPTETTKRSAKAVPPSAADEAPLEAETAPEAQVAGGEGAAAAKPARRPTAKRAPKAAVTEQESEMEEPGDGA